MGSVINRKHQERKVRMNVNEVSVTAPNRRHAEQPLLSHPSGSFLSSQKSLSLSSGEYLRNERGQKGVATPFPFLVHSRLRSFCPPEVLLYYSRTAGSGITDEW